MSNLRHGFTKHSERDRANPRWRAHVAWCHLKQRCNSNASKDWKNYGGRGITYDPRWESFEAFIADVGLPPLGTSIDRRDNNGPYSKDNCRWATRKEQNVNKRNARILELNGERKAVWEWARDLGVRPGLIRVRLNRGWPAERALCV